MRFGPRDEQRRKQVALWVAVCGTMAVIVALWVLVLPTQLQGAGSRSASRWGAAQDAPTEKKSFGEVLQEQRDRLDQIETNSATPTP